MPTKKKQSSSIKVVESGGGDLLAEFVAEFAIPIQGEGEYCIKDLMEKMNIKSRDSIRHALDKWTAAGRVVQVGRRRCPGIRNPQMCYRFVK